MINKTSALITAALASTIGLAACADSNENTDPVSAATHRVEHAYARLGELTQTTEPAVATTQITETGRVIDIAERRFTDLVTYFPSEQVRLETTLHGPGAVAYSIHWLDGETPKGNPPDYTFRQVWEMAQGTPTSTLAVPVPLDDSGLYVRYHVQLQLAQRASSYDAILIMNHGEAIVIDPVLWMMNRVARETLTAAGSVQTNTPDLAATLDAALGSDSGSGLGSDVVALPPACTASQWINPNPVVDSHSGTQWHTTGFHSAISSSNYRCNCDTSCVSTCTPMGSSTATETGVFVPWPGLGWWHADHSERRDVPGTAQPGAGATCDSAGGALVKNCLFGVLCDIHIGFEYGGVGIGVVIPEGVWPATVFVSAKSSLRGTCAACVPAAPAPAI